MEFQGGEPSLEYDLMDIGIKYALEKNKDQKRELTFVLCTNCTNLSPDILDMCNRYEILISTSLDGPDWIHDANRGKKDSHKRNRISQRSIRT